MILPRDHLPERFTSEMHLRRWMMGYAEHLGYHVSWVEAHESAVGIPDLNICVDGVDMWIELKIIHKGQIKLRPTQKSWHSERFAKGGISWVLVVDRDRMDFLLVNGALAAALSTSETVWRQAALLVRMDEKFFERLLEDQIHARQRTSDRERAAQSTREAASALSTSGENVGGGHWLLDKP